MAPFVKTYKLDGGSKVTVYKVFGTRHYFAVVDMDGHYPGKGKISHNVGRNEFILVLSGELLVTKNGRKKTLKTGMTLLLENGCKYEILGKGKSLVFVDDGEAGKGESLVETK